MNTFYAIIYAFIRPDIDEKISIGLICVTNNKLYLKTSDEKVKIAKNLVSKHLALALENELSSISSKVALAKNDSIFNAQYFNYLNKYKNNVIGISIANHLDIEINEDIFNKLYSKYISENTSNTFFIRERKKSATNLYSSTNS
ncbi:MAG: hypothetical protein ACPG5B_05405 [Chitinophagales bacterium]